MCSSRHCSEHSTRDRKETAVGEHGMRTEENHHDIAALDFGDPSDILGYEEGELLDKVEVANPFYDYVKPDLVNLFITNE
jgi:translation initiation factor 2B subunit (eIF-2B alpha/beta/delta family)